MVIFRISAPGFTLRGVDRMLEPSHAGLISRSHLALNLAFSRSDSISTLALFSLFSSPSSASSASQSHKQNSKQRKREESEKHFPLLFLSPCPFFLLSLIFLSFSSYH
ncbi:hypothetical protein VTH06DRAFT_524 [Thermothelomyces fergusii]